MRLPGRSYSEESFQPVLKKTVVGESFEKRMI
jgi:hypothetical protein